MGLRKKTLILVGSAFLILMTTLIITSRLVVLEGFTQLESQDVRLNIKRGLSEISNVLDGLNSTAGDWGPWDDTYEFIQNHNEDYIKNNLNIDTLANLRVNFMLFVNLSGRLKFGKFVDLTEESETPLPAGLFEEVLSCNILIKHDDADSSKTGVLMFDNVPILIASRPILKSDFSGPIRGVLIVGRYLDSAEISRLSKINHLRLEIQPFKDSHMAPDFQRATSSISEEVPIFVEAESIKTIAGYAIQQDIRKNPGFILKIQIPRKIYQHGRATLQYYTFSILAIGLIFIALIMVFLEKGVLSPLIRLSTKVAQICQTDNFEKVISFSRKDELGKLAKEINGMLEQIHKKTTELSKTNADLINEIAERKRVEEDLLGNKRRLHKQNRVIMELSKIKLHETGDLKAAISKITEAVAPTLTVERVSVWLHSKDYSKIKCIDLYEYSKRRHSKCMGFFSKDYPSYFKGLQEKRVMAVHDAHNDSQTSEFKDSYLKPLGITSILDAPIRIGGQGVGVVRIEHVGPKRQWTMDEQTFAASIADLVTLAIQAIEHRRFEEEKKMMQLQLQQSSKMEAIGTLAGGIAHDFNNILGIILGNMELALDDVPKWNRAHFNLEEIRSASLRAKDVVKQLLSFARKTELERKPIRLIPIIKDSVRLLRATIPMSIDIRQNIKDTSDTIFADPIQIHQVMINLCTNASHAMQKTGGILGIEIENVILTEDSDALHPDLTPGMYVKLKVSDNGQGINPEFKDRIYDPYFTTKGVGKGTGMGLSVVHGIVKNHGGTISVESELGKGTTFYIYFPVIEEEPVIEVETVEELPKGNERILFVDDEKSMVCVGRYRLEGLGYQVESKTSPVEALELFRANPDQFDLVITDMTMPQMTGDQLIKEILKIRPDTPTIICTGFSENMDEEKAKEIGIRQYLEKPLNRSDLAKLVRKVLDEK